MSLLIVKSLIEMKNSSVIKYNGNISEKLLADCGTPVFSTGVKANYTNTTYLSTVTYSCKEGYKYTSGDLISTCLDTRVWNGTAVVCTIVGK